MPDKWDQYAAPADASDKWAQYATQVAPAVDLSNKEGQGVYQMSDKSGKTVPVPYGQVQKAAESGYSFADDANKFRFAKDNAADPNKATVFRPAGDTAPLDNQAPGLMQFTTGVVKGIGSLGKPAYDVLGRVSGVPQKTIDSSFSPSTPTEGIGKLALMGAAAAPAAVAAPIGTAGAAVGGSVGAMAGDVIGNASGMKPENTALLSDALGAAGGTAGAIGAGAAGNALNYNAKILGAKQLFGIVAKDANKVPVQLENAQEGALNLMQWQKQTTLGPTVNKFLNRITDPKQGPLTYEEARRAYQLLGKLSADESMKMNPAVRRDLTQMVVGLKQDIGNAADTVGQASNYYQAMGDMATGKRLEGWADFAKKWIVKAALGGGLAYDVYRHSQ